MTEPGDRAIELPELTGVVDVGGSHVTTAIVRREQDANILSGRRRTAIDANARTADLLDQLSAGAAATPGVTRWVIALPGPFDYERGTGDFAGVAKFGSLAGVDLRQEFGRRLGVTEDAISFVNDAVAYAVGEWVATVDRPRQFVCVTLGTGVGSAWLRDGRAVDHGPEVPPHGWAHLLELAGRPLEDTVSTRAIIADYSHRSGRRLEVRDIAVAARRGDAAAAETLRTAFLGLGRALGPWLTRFAADRLVVGGAMSRAWDLIEGPLAEGVAASGPAGLPLTPAVLLDDAPLIGAAEWFSRGTG